MDEILLLYKKYNRPGAQKLLQLSRSEGIQATPKQIKEFLASRTEEQQLKESRNTKQSHGHIVSYNPFNRLQLDIFVLKKYESSNNGYGYILCIIDIFSRKVWCYPMKSKSLSDTTPAIKKFFNTSGLHEFNSKALACLCCHSCCCRDISVIEEHSCCGVFIYTYVYTKYLQCLTPVLYRK